MELVIREKDRRSIGTRGVNCRAAQLHAEADAARLRIGAEAPRTPINDAGVTPADISLALLDAARTLHPSRRSAVAAWTLAAQLSVRPLARLTGADNARRLLVSDVGRVVARFR